MSLPMTHTEFLQKCQNTHKNRYNYSITKYVNKRTKVTIVCKIHGSFDVFPAIHYKGANCPHCAKITEHRTKGYPIGYQSSKNKGSFLKFIKATTGYYFSKRDTSYTLLNPGAKITNIEKDTLLLQCKTHGTFKMTVRAYLKGTHCKHCVYNSRPIQVLFKDFVNRSNKIHKHKYTYHENTFTNISSKVLITCPVHGDFYQAASQHSRGAQCRYCSYGEVSNWKPDFYRNKKTIFYVLSLPNDLYKIGITTQPSVQKRYSGEKTNFTIIYEYEFSDGYYAREYEIKLLRDLKAFKYTGNFIMTTVNNKEILTINPVSIIDKQIRRLF